MAGPHPWEIPFEWNEFLRRWFRAIDSRDSETLLRFSCVDLVSERVGHTPLQRSREGFIESLNPLWESRTCKHEWQLTVASGPDAVVEWTRSDPSGGGPVTHGVSFMQIREGMGMLALIRTHENPPGVVPDVRSVKPDRQRPDS